MTMKHIFSLFTRARLLCAAILLVMPLLAQAHTGLKSSKPADAATVQAPPAAIELEFHAPVRLIRVEVKGEGHAMPSNFEPASEALASYRIETPGMHPGKFTVSWAAMGADGHTMADSFSFTVDPAADSAP